MPGPGPARRMLTCLAAVHAEAVGGWESYLAEVTLGHTLWLCWAQSQRITPEAACGWDPGSQPGPQSLALAPRYI